MFPDGYVWVPGHAEFTALLHQLCHYLELSVCELYAVRGKGLGSHVPQSDPPGQLVPAVCF